MKKFRSFITAAQKTKGMIIDLIKIKSVCYRLTDIPIMVMIVVNKLIHQTTT